MKIQFNAVIYELVDRPNVHGTHFQATISKEGVSIDALLKDLEDTSNIIVYDDDDNLAGVYKGYTNPVAVSIGDNVGVELENTNIESVIIDLQAQMANMIQNDGVVELIFANVSSLPKTIYDENVVSSMKLLNKELSNPNATITDFGITITDGSVTISGVVSETTDITLYLTSTN